MSAPTLFCWTCYARLPGEHPDRCPTCGGPVHPPEDVTFTGTLLWALHHPLVGRRIVAADALARRGEARAVAPLTEMATDPDPYLAAAAVRALAAFDDRNLDTLLDHLGQAGPARVRHAVRETTHTGGADRCAPQGGSVGTGDGSRQGATAARTAQHRADGPCPLTEGQALP